MEKRWSSGERSPLGGAISSLHIIDREGNVLIAVEYGNIWRSEDGGNSWFSVSKATCQTFLAQNPQDLTTMYVGTRLEGLLKSVDCGKTWIFTNTEQLGRLSIKTEIGTLQGIGWLGIDKDGNVWVGAPEGFFRSTDGGDSWTKMYDLIAAEEVKEKTILDQQQLGEAISDILGYKAQLAKGMEGKFLASRDNGETWEEIKEADGSLLELLHQYWQLVDKYWEAAKAPQEFWQKLSLVVDATTQYPVVSSDQLSVIRIPSLADMAIATMTTDANNSNNVLVAADSRLFFTLDGEKTWYEINLPTNIDVEPWWQFVDVQIISDQASLKLFMTIGSQVWQTTLPLKSPPF